MSGAFLIQHTRHPHLQVLVTKETKRHFVGVTGATYGKRLWARMAWPTPPVEPARDEWIESVAREAED